MRRSTIIAARLAASVFAADLQRAHVQEPFEDLHPASTAALTKVVLVVVVRALIGGRTVACST